MGVVIINIVVDGIDIVVGDLLRLVWTELVAKCGRLILERLEGLVLGVVFSFKRLNSFILLSINIAKFALDVIEIKLKITSFDSYLFLKFSSLVFEDLEKLSNPLELFFLDSLAAILS